MLFWNSGPLPFTHYPLLVNITSASANNPFVFDYLVYTTQTSTSASGPLQISSPLQGSTSLSNALSLTPTPSTPGAQSSPSSGSSTSSSSPSSQTEQDSPQNAEGSSKRSHTGAIAGGVIGGVVALVIALLVFWWWRRHINGPRERLNEGMSAPQVSQPKIREACLT